MPNWCQNTVRVTGDPEQVRRMAGELESGNGLMDTFVPMPEKYVGTVSGSNPVTADDGLDWYQWQMRNWGVKWGDRDLTISLQDDELTLIFETPWGPPVQGLLTISTVFPLIEVFDDWDDPDMPTKGFVSIKNGEITGDTGVLA